MTDAQDKAQCRWCDYVGDDLREHAHKVHPKEWEAATARPQDNAARDETEIERASEVLREHGPDAWDFDDERD